jgi:hypothetical protein
MSQDDNSSDPRINRRDALKIGAAGATALIGSKLASDKIDASNLKPDILKRLGYIDKDNISVLKNFLDISIGGDLRDFRYRPKHTAIKASAVFRAGPEGQNNFQRYNPSEAFLSTRDDGTGATVTEGRAPRFFLSSVYRVFDVATLLYAR